MPCREAIISKQNEAAEIRSRKKSKLPGYVMVIGLHAERPRNRVSIPKVGRMSRPILGSMLLVDAGDFPQG
jgi:hypothetical protein